MKPKVGDWVILKKKRPSGWASNGGMDEFLGKRVQLTRISNHNIYFEGSGSWSFWISCIEKIDNDPVINDNYSVI